MIIFSKDDSANLSFDEFIRIFSQSNDGSEEFCSMMVIAE
jgi:hypothetical protein